MRRFVCNSWHLFRCLLNVGRNNLTMTDTRFLDDLRARYNAGELLKYVFFWGYKPRKNGVSVTCLSQWYEAPFVLNHECFATAEHFMMAEKAALFGDLEARAKILQASSPGAVKALGRGIRNFDEAVWIENRFSIVVRGNAAKFEQNPALAEFLQQTGNRVLVEASPVDRIWGIGLAQNDEKANNPNLWVGLNLLGFALMQVRGGI